jgi:molybdopterin-biosynthesis enzyme MoeA-like protein
MGNVWFSFECQFCRVFGKIRRQDGVRAVRSNNIKMFTKPGQPDHMKTHMVEQHQQQLEQYAALPPGDNSNPLHTLFHALAVKQKSQSSLGQQLRMIPPSTYGLTGP